jgi:DeoR/GlpR family transcriptional regulator of sugar metabolism
MALGAHPEAPLRQRTGEAFEQKHAIVRWAASVIVPGENILLDAGSTVNALAHELRGFEKLSVTTPGINTMQELADSEGIEVDCLGLPAAQPLAEFCRAPGRGGAGADEI